MRDELEITLQARRDLGPDYERELIESFLERIAAHIDRRVDEHLRAYERRRRRTTIGFGVALFLVLLTAIPLTLVAGLTAGPAGIAVVWGGLLLLTTLLGILSRV